jgi:hypothetical protein
VAGELKEVEVRILREREGDRLYGRARTRNRPPEWCHRSHNDDSVNREGPCDVIGFLLWVLLVCDGVTPLPQIDRVAVRIEPDTTYRPRT